MTNEEIMARIALAFDPVRPDSPLQSDNRTTVVAQLRYLRPLDGYGKASATGTPRLSWTAMLTHEHGKAVGEGDALEKALRHLLKNLASEPLTMAQHDALQALRVEVGL